MTKTYVITGATSGIGMELVKILAKDNIVFAGYRDEKKIEKYSEISTSILPFYVDYSKPETIIEAVRYIKSKCEKIDTLINVAGCVVAGPCERISVDEIRRQFNVNTFGHLELSQGLLEYLEGGRIINVSSMASYGIFPFVAPYCASKRALDMLFNSILMETKKDIKIISVKPGVIATPLWDKSVDENLKHQERKAGFEKEMEYLINNARDNGKYGANVQTVVKTILKADRTKFPKLSYTVGLDAFVAHYFSLLPQCIINKIVRLGVSKKILN
ncbi:MAG: SDR family NAD(P)-dependent oxidoreductase [bacterium]|nr:SDR family NAD(P)-dependent oxidoreductase [bacterium]